jgi:hypothetical protein
LLSGLLRSVLFDNYWKLVAPIGQIDDLISSMVDKPEKDINPALVGKIKSSLHDLNLGSIRFKGHFFDVTIETETEVSHQRYCIMDLPSRKKKSELGDIIIAVDYVLDDIVKQRRRIIDGAASVIETKMEKTAKNRLTAAQLYLMTQWPQFSFGTKSDWKLNVFSDNFGFYLFILDPTTTKSEKSSILSAPMIKYYSEIDKTILLSRIDGTVSFRTDLLRREKCGKMMMPLPFGSYLFHALYLAFGSPSINFRELLKGFFPLMEEVEDCYDEAQTFQSKSNSAQLSKMSEMANGKPMGCSPFDDEDGDLFAVRIKVILKRTD